METTKQQPTLSMRTSLGRAKIEEFAKACGADDVRFASAVDFDLPFDTPSPHSLLPNATCIIVLFVRYAPSAPPLKDCMTLSAYYPASHRAFLAAKQVTTYITHKGAKAVHSAALPSKAVALRTGGLLGDNGFYYHPDFGSYVSIQTILTDAIVPDVPVPPQPKTECLHCGACRASCPSNGVGNLKNCLRYHLFGLVPEHLRGDVYQLLGCEKCQTACPINTKISSHPNAFAVDQLLIGKHIDELKALAGTNFVRTQRIRSQAALYAANIGASYLSDTLNKMRETSPTPVCEHARWALDKLIRTKGECT